MTKRGPKFKYDPLDLAEKLHDFVDTHDDPRLSAFCVIRGNPCRDTLHELSKSCKELSDAIMRAKLKCEDYLCSAKCGVHPKIAGIRLATNHNMTERLQQDVSMAGSLEIKWAGDE